MSPPAPIAAMAQYRQWLNWIAVHRADGHTDKLPVSPHTGDVCNAHDPASWGDYEQAVATGMPIAFAFTDHDPFAFVDIDGCMGNDGDWDPTARYICAQFPGCAMEVSQSGRGLHIFFTVPPGEYPHRTVSEPLGTQFYTAKRFVAITGIGLTGDAALSPDPQVYATFIGAYFPAGAALSGGDDADWTTEPDAGWDGPDDDDELIRRMLRSRSVKSLVGGGVTVRQLWEGDEDALGAVWPDGGGQGRAYDATMPDAALCSHLAFWTGKNCERMQRLWGQSALGQREKFHTRPDYVRRTVLKAASGCTAVYQQRRPAAPGPPAAPGDLREGYQLLDPVSQVEHFKGCTYVTTPHGVYCPGGTLMKPEQFRARYGGYVFHLDNMGDKTTRNAWEAFTESQAVTHPKVDGVCFKPGEPPGSVVERDGLSLVNTYVPINTPTIPGDPRPFLDLVAKMLPVPHDQAVLLAYMAAVIQYPGHKFYWCPLVQGCEGNGKTFLVECLQFAVGLRYSHQIEATDISSKFNAWVMDTIFASIEEIKVHQSDRDTMNILKKLITNNTLPVQRKGVDQTTAENCVKLFLCSNFKDAVSKTENDRRFAILYGAQQIASDLERTGMGGDYFPHLWTWARVHNGFAIVNHYLREYAIPDELNPATLCHRAPQTSTTQEALLYCRGNIEQRILEAVEEERQGFSGGWVSSMAVDSLIKENRAKVPLNKRAEMLASIGYIPHPALPRGRVNNTLIHEGGKPRLYLKEGHIALNETNCANIARLYCDAQRYTLGGAPPQQEVKS